MCVCGGGGARVRACVHVCACVCVSACAGVCVCGGGGGYPTGAWSGVIGHSRNPDLSLDHSLDHSQDHSLDYSHSSDRWCAQPPAGSTAPPPHLDAMQERQAQAPHPTPLTCAPTCNSCRGMSAAGSTACAASSMTSAS